MRTLVVTGAHAVGKTTLCNQLVQALGRKTKVELIPEMARILMAKGIPLNDKATEYAIVAYISEYLNATRNTSAPFVISDRSVFDLYAYISVSRDGSVRDEFVNLAAEVVYQEVARVEAYIYVPIEFQMQPDEVRPEGLAYQRTIDETVRHLLKLFRARVISVSGSLEQRAATVVRYLNV